jgi:hypothetical protein
MLLSNIFMTLDTSTIDLVSFEALLRNLDAFARVRYS